MIRRNEELGIEAGPVKLGETKETLCPVPPHFGGPTAQNMRRYRACLQMRTCRCFAPFGRWSNGLPSLGSCEEARSGAAFCLLGARVHPMAGHLRRRCLVRAAGGRLFLWPCRLGMVGYLLFVCKVSGGDPSRGRADVRACWSHFAGSGR